MEMRKEIQVPGIPVVWETNLSNAELKDLFELIRGDRELEESRLKVEVPRISIRLYYKPVLFKDGLVVCMGVLPHINAIYRTTNEWLLWDAHRKEVEELHAEQEQILQADIQVFLAQDEFWKQKARQAAHAGDGPTVRECLNNRVQIRRDQPHLEKHVYSRWNLLQDGMEVFAEIPDTSFAIEFLAQQAEHPTWYGHFVQQYMWHKARIYMSRHDIMDDAYWRERMRSEPSYQDAILRAERVFVAALSRFPNNGFVYRDACRFLARECSYEKAIEYCEGAIQKGLQDDTKAGFQGRLARLQKKIAKAGIPTTPKEGADMRRRTPARDVTERSPIRLSILNVMGEMLLDDLQKDEATVTPDELAVHFHSQLESLFMNKVCDEDGDRKNMVGILEMNLKTFKVAGPDFPGHPGFISIGTVLLKRDAEPSDVKLTFRFNPRGVVLYEKRKKA